MDKGRTQKKDQEDKRIDEYLQYTPISQYVSRKKDLILFTNPSARAGYDTSQFLSGV